MNPRPQRPERCALARLRYSPKAKNYKLICRICPADAQFFMVILPEEKGRGAVECGYFLAIIIIPKIFNLQSENIPA